MQYDLVSGRARPRYVPAYVLGNRRILGEGDFNQRVAGARAISSHFNELAQEDPPARDQPEEP